MVLPLARTVPHQSVPPPLLPRFRGFAVSVCAPFALNSTDKRTSTTVWPTLTERRLIEASDRSPEWIILRQRVPSNYRRPVQGRPLQRLAFEALAWQRSRSSRERQHQLAHLRERILAAKPRLPRRFLGSAAGGSRIFNARGAASCIGLAY